MNGQAPPQAAHALPLALLPGDRLSFMGPALAAVAGAMASGRLHPVPSSLVTLGLAVLLADPLLGGLWSSATGARWRERWEAASPRTSPPLRLPHTVPGSLAHRLGEALDKVRAAGTGSDEGPLPLALARAAFFLAASLVVGAALAPEVLLVVVAAAAMAMLQAVLGPYVPGIRWPESVGLFAGAWLIGFGAFGGLPLTGLELPLVALASAWTIAHLGFRGLSLGDPAARTLAALDGGQIAAALLLIAMQRPWQGGAVLLLLAAQALGQPRFWRDHDGRACSEGTLPFVLVAVVVTFL